MKPLKSMELGGISFLRRIAVISAAGFGLGLSPVASGTTGALLGLPVMLGLHKVWGMGAFAQALAAICLAAAAIPVCSIAERHFGKKDDGRIVADEFMTFPIGLIALPICPLTLALAFFTHRFFDVLKPFPAYRLQLLPGGYGIVLDDVVAAFYGLLANHAIYYGLKTYNLIS